MLRSEVGETRIKRLQDRQASHRVVVTLVACFAVLGWWWFLFFSGFFDVSSIDVQGLETLERGEVVAQVEDVFKQQPWRPWHVRNTLLLDEQEMASKLKERIFVEDIAVDKSYPDVLRLLIKERQRSVVLVSQEQYVNVDSSGVVTGALEGPLLDAAKDIVAARAFVTDKTLPVIVMPTADPLAPGFQVAEPAQVRRWLDATHMMIQRGLKFRFMKVETPGASLARVVSERGYDMYFDLSQPVDRQIANYEAYMKTKPDESKIREHLDLRVPGRVFIR